MSCARKFSQILLVDINYLLLKGFLEFLATSAPIFFVSTFRAEISGNDKRDLEKLIKTQHLFRYFCHKITSLTMIYFADFEEVLFIVSSADILGMRL